MSSRNRKRRPCRAGGVGMTLLEILIVVVFIAILIAIAAPMMLKSKAASNEVSAIATLRTICTAETQYQVTYREYGDLSGLGHSRCVDIALASGRRSGYLFQAVPDALATWHADAIPEVYRNTGVRCYRVDESGTLRGVDAGGSAFVPRADSDAWPEVGQ